jgi:predicted nucleotide-binding protein/transcriptional regulator with XRE-family HTH domain
VKVGDFVFLQHKFKISTDMEKKFVQSNLHKLRKAWKLSIPELSKAINISTRALYAYESGHRNLQLKRLREFSDFYKISVDDLLYKNLEEIDIPARWGQSVEKTEVKYSDLANKFLITLFRNNNNSFLSLSNVLNANELGSFTETKKEKFLLLLERKGLVERKGADKSNPLGHFAITLKGKEMVEDGDLLGVEFDKMMVEKIPSTSENMEPKIAKKQANQPSKNVFIVHGHNNEVKLEVANTLHRLGLNPIILHEQANEGKTIIEKFEKHSDVGFAVVLLTSDDLGKAKNDGELSQRARQNVILELGYFIGKIGRHNVVPLYTHGVELPSDLSGVVYVLLDSSGAWKMNLARELKAAGYKINAEGLL